MLTGGNVADCTAGEELLARLPPCEILHADKGYDSNAIRWWVEARGAWANIPPKSNRKEPICFSKHLYKARNLVERFFNKIKHYRRIATRYDKTAENFLATLKLVAIRIWLRDNESTA
jgi:transposase